MIIEFILASLFVNMAHDVDLTWMMESNTPNQ